MSTYNEQKTDRNEQIYQLTTLVAGEFSLPEVLDKLAKAAVEIAGVKACSIRLLDEESGQLKMQSTYGLSKAYRNQPAVAKTDAVVSAAFAGEAVVVDDMRLDKRVKNKHAVQREGLVSQLTVAMQYKNTAIGVIRLYSPRPKRFEDQDISLARAVASQCAVAITNAKLFAKAIQNAHITEQVRLAGLLQRRMIPDKAPSVEGLDIAATYIPCFEVGGDFYDFITINDSTIGAAIADVMGKGVPAAIMMSFFRATVRAYGQGATGTAGMQQLIRMLNKTACAECRDGEFVTLFYAVIETKNNTMTYCNCGHEPAVLIRDGRLSDLDRGGLVLGVDRAAEYAIGSVRLKKDDCLLFYTDGLIDAPNFQGQMWGRKNLLKTARMLSGDSADHIVKNILRYRRRFVGLAKQIDDTSIIAVKVTGPR